MSLLSSGFFGTTTTTTTSIISKASDGVELTSSFWLGTRGNTWKGCDSWFNTMPGSLFQLTCLLLFFAFMAGGQHMVAASYIHIVCTFAFFVFSIFGIFDVCSIDFAVWGALLVFINIAQVLVTTFFSLSELKI